MQLQGALGIMYGTDLQQPRSLVIALGPEQRVYMRLVPLTLPMHQTGQKYAHDGLRLLQHHVVDLQPGRGILHGSTIVSCARFLISGRSTR